MKMKMKTKSKMSMEKCVMVDNRMVHDTHQMGISRKVQRKSSMDKNKWMEGNPAKDGMIGKSHPSGKMNGHAGSLDNWKRTSNYLVPREA